MIKVAIIHPWFPRYRLEFFEGLVQKAALYGIDVRVYHGDPPPEWEARGDAVQAEWATRLPTKFFKIGSKSLVWKRLAAVREDGPFDLYVLEHAVRSLETYLLLVKYRHRIAFWGHGRTYTQPANVLQEYVKKRLLSWSQWYFAYTQGGAATVHSGGFRHDRITVVQNSIDTRTLRDAVTAVTEADAREFMHKHKLNGPTALFVGGLDASKRLGFLLEACSIVADSMPSFRLLVAGDGDERRTIEQWASRAPWCRYIGPVYGNEKATAMRVADVLAIPGRVGLVAVDSFAAGLPIVTTNWPYHAPEFEYLQDGVNALVTTDEVNRYASALVNLLQNQEGLKMLKDGCHRKSEIFTVEQMTDNFLSGLRGALGMV